MFILVTVPDSISFDAFGPFLVLKNCSNSRLPQMQPKISWLHAFLPKEVQVAHLCPMLPLLLPEITFLAHSQV